MRYPCAPGSGPAGKRVSAWRCQDSPPPPAVVTRRRRWNVTPYLFILPHLIFFAAFLGYPFFYGLYMSLFEFDFLRPERRPFVGLRNYTRLFDQIPMGRYFWNSLLVAAITTVLQAGRNRHEHIMESLELFAREVMPEFKERDEKHVVAKQQRLHAGRDVAIACLLAASFKAVSKLTCLLLYPGVSTLAISAARRSSIWRKTS